MRATTVTSSSSVRSSAPRASISTGYVGLESAAPQRPRNDLGEGFFVLDDQSRFRRQGRAVDRLNSALSAIC